MFQSSRHLSKFGYLGVTAPWFANCMPILPPLCVFEALANPFLSFCSLKLPGLFFLKFDITLVGA